MTKREKIEELKAELARVDQFLVTTPRKRAWSLTIKVLKSRRKLAQTKLAELESEERDEVR